MKILVTGGLGFIGRSCVRKLLEHGCSVVVLDNLSPEVHGMQPDLAGLTADWSGDVSVQIGSVTNRELVFRLVDGASKVLHLACLNSIPGSLREESCYVDVNVVGTSITCQAAKASGSVDHVVLSSSRAVYGEGRYRCSGCGTDQFIGQRSKAQLAKEHWDPVCPSCGVTLTYLPSREDDLLRAASIYGMTKVAQEDLLRTSLGAAGVAVTILRLQNVYGPGGDRFLPDVGVANVLTRQALAGRTLDLYEDGEQLRDFLFVDDAARLLVQAVLDPEPTLPFSVLNVGAGTTTSLRQLAEAIFRAIDREPRYRTTGQFRLGDIRHSITELGRLRDKRPWDPVPLAEGLARLVATLKP